NSRVLGLSLGRQIHRCKKILIKTQVNCLALSCWAVFLLFNNRRCWMDVRFSPVFWIKYIPLPSLFSFLRLFRTYAKLPPPSILIMFPPLPQNSFVIFCYFVFYSTVFSCYYYVIQRRRVIENEFEKSVVKRSCGRMYFIYY